MQMLNPNGLPVSEGAQRIVSLVPSLTETLYHLGLDAETVGITKFCVHPQAWFQTKPRIGGTKQVDMEKVQALQPDLIIAGKEENERRQVEALAAFCPVLLTDIITYPDTLDAIADIGKLTQRQEAATQLGMNIQSAFNKLHFAGGKKAAYFMWRQPWMVAGGDTFIHHMMEAAGIHNVFGHCSRYPVITPEELAQLDVDFLLLSSEPYPFAEKHKKEFEQVLPSARPVLVDGEMFSWYGSRLLEAAPYFERLQQIMC